MEIKLHFLLLIMAYFKIAKIYESDKVSKICTIEFRIMGTRLKLSLTVFCN